MKLTESWRTGELSKTVKLQMIELHLKLQFETGSEHGRKIYYNGYSIFTLQKLNIQDLAD